MAVSAKDSAHHPTSNSSTANVLSRWVTHDLGRTHINGVPQRVVVLNWTQAEVLLTLDTVPVGVPTLAGYRYWQSNHPPMPTQGVVDIGHRGMPSLQAIAALKPDLIIGYRFRHAKLYQQLQAIAPTLIFSQYPSADDPRNYFERMQANFKTVAEVLGKSSQADTILANMHRDIAAAQQRIVASGRAGEATLFGKFVGMGMGLRVYGDQSLAGAIIQRLGLRNAWSDSLPGRDFTHLQLVQLSQLDNANLIYVGELHKEGMNIVSSPVWPLLPFVQQQRLYQSPQLWNFGGPVSASRMAASFADVLLQPRSISSVSDMHTHNVGAP